MAIFPVFFEEMHDWMATYSDFGGVIVRMGAVNQLTQPMGQWKRPFFVS